VATGGVAVVPGDDGFGGEEEWASMEEKITAKYMPGKLAALTEGGAADPEAAKRREATASAVAQFKGGQDSNSQVYSCANCDGQGKVCTQKASHSVTKSIQLLHPSPSPAFSLADGHATSCSFGISAVTVHTGTLQVYSTLNLTDYGSEGMTRVMESCCQECMGMGIINKKDPLVMAPTLVSASAASSVRAMQSVGLTTGWIPCLLQAAKARKDASQGGTGSNGADRNKPQEVKRLDQDDPPVDMDAILAKAGPCPFASRRKK